MTRFTSLLIVFSLFIGTGVNTGYTKQTSVKEMIGMLFNKKEVISEYHSGTPSDEVFDENSEFSPDDCGTVVIEKGKDFRILTVDDIHLSDFGYRVFTSFFSIITLKRLVAKTHPDLIILPGDIVCGDADEYSIRRLTDLMEGFGIPWAPVFGNHDDEANCDLNYLADVMMSGPHCLMKKGDPAMGVGNYVVNIAEDNGDGTRNIIESVIMMDSHHNQPNELQHKWYKWVTDGISRLTDGKSEISVVMHIPIPEYRYAYDEAYNDETKSWNDGYKAYGSLHETICCEYDADGNPVQRGFFDVLKQCGTSYVFCGHDHMNDFSIEYEGIRLTYLMKLGISSGFQVGFNGGSLITGNADGIYRIQHKTATYGIIVDAEDIPCD